MFCANLVHPPVWVTGIVIDDLLPLLDNLSCSAVVVVAEVARVGLIPHNLCHPSSIATIVAVVVLVAC